MVILGKERKRKSKYKNNEERLEGKRASNRKSYRKCKAMSKKLLIDFEPTRTFDNQYQLGLFNWQKNIDYTGFATVTTTVHVTQKKLESLVKDLLDYLEKQKYISGGFKVIELKDTNYHCHFTFINTGIAKSITGVIKRHWQDNGFADVKGISSQFDKEQIIEYMVKQLRPSSARNKYQELIDSWEYRKTVDLRTHPDIFRNLEFLIPLWDSKDYVYKSKGKTFQEKYTGCNIDNKINICGGESPFFEHGIFINMKELTLHTKQVEAFLLKINNLELKFNNKYIDGELCNYVKLDVVAGRPELKFIGSVPEMVKIACYMVFVDTML